MLKGDYYYHSTISDDVQDQVFLSMTVNEPSFLFYAEAYPYLMTLIENILGVNQFTISEEQYHAMQNSNRFFFYLKYFNDYREIKRNIVGLLLLVHAACHLLDYFGHPHRDRAAWRSVRPLSDAVHSEPPPQWSAAREEE